MIFLILIFFFEAYISRGGTYWLKAMSPQYLLGWWIVSMFGLLFRLPPNSRVHCLKFVYKPHRSSALLHSFVDTYMKRDAPRSIHWALAASALYGVSGTLGSGRILGEGGPFLSWSRWAIRWCLGCWLLDLEWLASFVGLSRVAFAWLPADVDVVVVVVVCGV
jgi:hypothetical protein